MHRNKSGFVSVVILLVLAFVFLNYYFRFNIITFLSKYINKENIGGVDEKILYYFKIIWNYIVITYKYVEGFIKK